MKRFLLFFAALLCCVSSFAQMNFVATLQHNDSISHYYGQEALAQAYDAAVDGDTITLSAGTFNVYWGNNSTPMCKSITIRGTGGVGGYTQIKKGSGSSDDIRIATRNKSMTTRFEGVYLLNITRIYNEDAQFEKGKIEFIKCQFDRLWASASGNPTTESPKVYLYNCLIFSEMYFDSNKSYPKYSFINSYVRNPHSISDLGNNTSIFDHCVIEYYNYSYVECYNYYLNYSNCIFARTDGSNSISQFPNTMTATNCLSIYFRSYNFFGNLLSGTNNQSTEDITTIFKTFRKGVGADETFELTDEAKTTYLGNDSTQLGMHGGIAPYNTKMQYPVVTKLMLEPRTTKDGKLTIDVQVDGK